MCLDVLSVEDLCLKEDGLSPRSEEGED